ncbi:MAG: alkaline phosphatase family protein [Wenzhouxiangellaceae bacterium]
MHSNIRFLSILLITALLLAACNPTRQTAGGETTAPPLLLISIDGFRHDYMEMTELPALQRLAADGLKADSLQHVFPTKTFVTHYALATGLYAENTGVVANSMWDPKRKSSFSLGNRNAVGDGYWYDGEPIWNTVEKAGGIAATYFWPGSEAQIGGIRPSIWKPYAGETPHDARIDQVLEWLDQPEERRPSFLTLYFSAVDSAGHAHGPGHPKTVEAMVEVDRALGRLIEGLEQRGLYRDMHILVTSDHGMQQVDLERYLLLDDFLDLGQIHVSDWGPAAQIWTREGGPTAEQIIASVDRDHPAIRRVWRKGNAPARYHFDNHQRVPDVTVEAKLGWMISNKPYYAGMQRGMLNGMHGWDPAWAVMHGIFIATGPAFEPGERLPAVRSVDLYSLMARLMDVPPAQTDGSIVAFEPLLGSDKPFAVRQARWRCGDDSMAVRITTRSVPGLAALHHEGRVFALPQAQSASGERFADTAVEFWDNGDQARIEIDGRLFPACSRVHEPDAG